jgi:hypothetical protein
VADLFLSYAREDQDVVRRLAHLFQCEDWSVWWDPQIALGEDFRPIIGAQIDASSVVVVLWSPAARGSTWVRWEADRAREAGKLVELVLTATEEPADSVADGALLVPRRPHLPPVRDELLRVVARSGNLCRRCDGWNSRLRATTWRGRRPKRPVVAWEFVPPPDGWDPEGTPDARVVRRERWLDTAVVEYGTTIGNLWLFGHENEVVAIGSLLVTAPEHSIRLPKPDRKAERADRPFTVPFNVDVRMVEGMTDVGWPSGGVDLAEGGPPDPSVSR